MDHHSSFALALIALVLAQFLLVWIQKQELCCKIMPKVIGYFTIVASILLMVCLVYISYSNCHAVKSCHQNSGMMMNTQMPANHPPVTETDNK